MDSQGKKFQIGIGLLELMLSLAIIAILLVAATRYYQTTVSSQRVNAGARMVATVTAAVDSWYDIFKTYSSPENTISTENLIKINLLPSDFAAPTANPWRGAVIIAPQGATQIKLTLTQVNYGDCLNLSAIEIKRGLTGGSCGQDANTYTLIYPNS